MFVNSTNAMTKEARKTAFLTSIATSAYTDISEQKRGTGKRERFVYLLPFCAIVCRIAFQGAYNISTDTLTKARCQVRDGKGYVEQHKNVSNQHTATINREAIVGWVRQFATQLGEPCPVLFAASAPPTASLSATLLGRRSCSCPRTSHGGVSTPSSLPFPPPETLMQSHLRSARFSKWCPRGATENQAAHALDARSMREQYAKDKGLIGSKRYVSTIDFAQNITLPHQASTPSTWYFLSLIGVSLFGIHTENSDRQTNYIYSERVAGEGSNEVISKLHAYALQTKIYSNSPGTAVRTIYADNRGGQNKNNHLLRCLRFLVDSARLRSASLYFLVKGHTKNNCDRGFGAIKRSFSKKDVYTMSQVEDVISESSNKNSVVNLECTDGVFLDWKSSLQTIYKDIKNIQSYQLFNFGSNTPATVSCRKRPTGETIDQQIAKVAEPDSDAVWASLKPLPKCGANPEKVFDLHAKILPFIPGEFQDDDLYRAPTASEIQTARERECRRKVTPTMAERQNATLREEEKEVS